MQRGVRPLVTVCILFLLGCAGRRPAANTAGEGFRPMASTTERAACVVVRSDPPGAHIFHTWGEYVGDTSFKLLSWNAWDGEVKKSDGDDLGRMVEVTCSCERVKFGLTAKKRGYQDTTAEMWISLKYPKDGVSDALQERQRQDCKEGWEVCIEVKRKAIDSVCQTMMIVLKPE